MSWDFDLSWLVTYALCYSHCNHDCIWMCGWRVSKWEVNTFTLTLERFSLVTTRNGYYIHA